MKVRSARLWIAVVLAAVILLAWFAASRASISALEEPGQFETWLTTKAKHELVGREAAQMHVSELASSSASANLGEMLFTVECSSCHGKNGRTPTHIGESMYPRVPDLGSAEIQKWSDPELFWIIQHGIRLSGMPGFERFDTDEQVWHLVHFIRTLPNQPKQP